MSMKMNSSLPKNFQLHEKYKFHPEKIFLNTFIYNWVFTRVHIGNPNINENRHNDTSSRVSTILPRFCAILSRIDPAIISSHANSPSNADTINIAKNTHDHNVPLRI